MTKRRPALASRRKAVGHTQESLAHEPGTDRSTIVRWEAGTTEPLPWQRPRIAKILGISTDQLEALAETVELLCHRYPSTAPDTLLVEIRWLAAQVSALLARRSTLAQRRRLMVAGGWLALLGATVHVDLGDRVGAVRARAAANGLARESEHPELAAWSAEIAAWTALVDQDWAAADRLAEGGLSRASWHGSAAVQLAAQRARALARLGDAAGVRAALDHAARALGRQPGRPADHHFTFDARKLEGYTATALAWLGDPAGESIAREVTARYQSGPVRRLATARVDLGLILARDGDPAEAAQLGLLAVGSGRLVSSNSWRVTELGAALAGQSTIPEVAELRTRLGQLGERHGG